MIPIGNSPPRSTPIRSPDALGSLVRERRKALRLTQMEVADQAGVGRRFLGELEDGKPTAQIGKALKVLAMLGITLTSVEG